MADLDRSALEARYERANAANDKLTVVEEDKKEAVRGDAIEASAELAAASVSTQVAPEPSE